jgi:hypothetical protein
MMASTSKLMLTAALLLGLFAPQAEAALRSVSGLPDPANNEVPAGSPPGTPVAVSLAHGFPIWYQDTNSLKLELCTAGAVQLVAGGPFIFPCIEAPPLALQPVSFPSNFGVEAFYWSAFASGFFTPSSDLQPRLALLVIGQEAGFLNNIPNDGDQVVGAGIRVRVETPVPGLYEVTHPFGTRTYNVPAVVGGERGIDQTQEVPALPAAGDFLSVLLNAPLPPPEPAPADPSINVGIVNQDGASIGPFLEASPAARITDINGNVYLTDPGTEILPNLVPIQLGPGGAVFSVTLTNPPAGFLLDSTGADGTIDNTLTINAFQVAGKIFNDGNNLAPEAVPDLAGTTRGVPAVIDVSLNDIDVVDDVVNGDNVHGLGLHPQAIAIVTDPVTLATSRLGPVTTVGGGSVRRVTNIATGRSLFVYTPPTDPVPGFVDSFSYVIQDTGGLISAPATVTVAVEDLTVAQAEFKPRTGKWRISGTTSHPAANSVTLFGGPRAALAPAQDVVSEATGSVSLRVTGLTSIDFQVKVDPLPATSVTAINIHTGPPGGTGSAFFHRHRQRHSQRLQSGTAAGPGNFQLRRRHQRHQQRQRPRPRRDRGQPDGRAQRTVHPPADRRGAGSR